MEWKEFKNMKIGTKLTNGPTLKYNYEETIIEAEFVAYDPNRNQVIIRTTPISFSTFEEYQAKYWDKIDN